MGKKKERTSPLFFCASTDFCFIRRRNGGNTKKLFDNFLGEIKLSIIFLDIQEKTEDYEGTGRNCK